MARRRRLLLALAALASTASAHRAEAQSAPLPEGKAAGLQPVIACSGLGQGFFVVPGTETCLRIGMDVFVETRGDFVNEDLSIETRRLPGPPAPGTPVAFYEAKDISATTEAYQQQSNGRVTFTTVSLLDGKPIISYVSLRSGYNDNAADRRQRSSRNNTGIGLEQAWISGLGVSAGLKPSVFDFSSGYTYSGGYASQRTLNQLSYEQRIGDNASLAFSVEDNAVRRYEEGVWALYGPQRYPDLVLRGRIEPGWGTVHVAAALHSINDALTGKQTAGFAVNAGLEYKQDWNTVFGDGAKGTYGRFLVTAAYADGALDYLGVPRFSSDYVIDADGSLVPTKGVSGLASYEHLWTSNFKTTATLALYRTQASLKDFDWTVQGGLVQAGAEYNPLPGTYVGGELSYYFDQAQGTYFDVPGAKTPVGYLQALAYIRRSL